MNIGSFLHRDQALYGVFNGETVAPASPGLIAQYPTLRELLDAEKSEALKGSVNLSANNPHRRDHIPAADSKPAQDYLCWYELSQALPR